MTIFTKRGVDVAAPVDSAGNPRQPVPQDFQRLFAEYEALLMALGADALDIQFPYGFINATNAGDGTANAIIATTDRAIPDADGGALIALPIVANNTGAATVSFNGGAVLTIKTSSGSNVSAAGLKAGMIVAGYVSGSTFRLLTDQASAAIVAAAESAADRAETAAASVDALVAPADLTALAALTAAQVTVGTSIEVRSSPGRFRVLAGSASSNGYTADGAVIVENDDGDTTFVRKDWLDRREVNALWFSPSTDGTSAATELQSWLDTATALAESRAKPAVAVIPEGVTLTTDAGLTVGSHVILGGGGTLKAHENLPLTDALIANKNLPGSTGQRQEENIQIKNIAIDGSARVYPKWLSDPATGEEITDPEADYSSPGVIDTAQYGSGADISDVVAAGRRNGDAPSTHGYLVRFRGVVDPVVEGLQVEDHGSYSIVFAGCLNAVARKIRMDNCGRIDTISPGILAGHAAGQPVNEVKVEVEKPVVPETVDKAVKKQTNGWGWSGVGLGGAGAALTAIAGWPWQTIAIFAGIGIAGGLVALVIGPWIVRRVKVIRAEVTA